MFEELVGAWATKRVKLKHGGDDFKCIVMALRVSLAQITRRSFIELIKIESCFPISHEAHTYGGWLSDEVEN